MLRLVRAFCVVEVVGGGDGPLKEEPGMLSTETPSKKNGRREGSNTRTMAGAIGGCG